MRASKLSAYTIFLLICSFICAGFNSETECSYFFMQHVASWWCCVLCRYFMARYMLYDSCLSRVKTLFIKLTFHAPSLYSSRENCFGFCPQLFILAEQDLLCNKYVLCCFFFVIMWLLIKLICPYQGICVMIFIIILQQRLYYSLTRPR